jgi:hypothetical protein
VRFRRTVEAGKYFTPKRLHQKNTLADPSRTRPPRSARPIASAPDHASHAVYPVNYSNGYHYLVTWGRFSQRHILPPHPIDGDSYRGVQNSYTPCECLVNK